MAECKVYHSVVELQLSLTLGEKEARALHATACYGADAFLKVFYAHLGSTYLKPHEPGLRSLFDLADSLRRQLDRADRARQAFNTIPVEDLGAR